MLISLSTPSGILHWFKDSGKGYLSRMNAVLRTYVEAQKLLHS